MIAVRLYDLLWEHMTRLQRGDSLCLSGRKVGAVCHPPAFSQSS